MEHNNNYRVFRERAKLTQQDAAEQLGISQAAISAYERGAKAPRVDVVADMAQLYNCSMEELLGRCIKHSLKFA
jgi:transcriptional regulator with XRE-family HTH domain